MGKTKIASIDDSQPLAERKEKKENRKKKQELNAEPQRSQSLSEPGEGGQNAQALTSVTPTEPVAEGEASLTGENGDAINSKLSKQPKLKKVKSSKAAVKKGQPKFRSAKYKKVSEKIEKGKRYPVTEAIDLAKQSSYSKFDGSLEIHLATNSKNIRGLVTLPFASGKKLKILAFGKGAEDCGADIVGDDNKLNEIIRGITNFDVIVTTPEWMPKLARAAKVLGPRGLMPSPKNGTITNDLKKAVSEIQSGKVEYKTEKNGQAIHLILGKVSQNTDEVVANSKILFNAIGKTRIKKAVISPTMGIGVKIDLASI